MTDSGRVLTGTLPRHVAVVDRSRSIRVHREKESFFFAQHRQALGFELSLTRLGHVQRGGAYRGESRPGWFRLWGP
jgi:6-phosphofructokinase